MEYNKDGSESVNSMGKPEEFIKATVQTYLYQNFPILIILFITGVISLSDIKNIVKKKRAERKKRKYLKRI